MQQTKKFTDLPQKFQQEIWGKFFDGELSFEDLERDYEINPETFRKFIDEEIELKYNKAYPKKDTEKISMVESISNFFDGYPFFRFLASFSLSVVLCIGFLIGGKALAAIGIDPFTNILVTCAIGSGGLFLLILTIKKNIIFFTDIENFRYFFKGGNYPRDYAYDLTNGLTTYERCKLNQDKYLWYLACYVAIYVATVMTFRMIALEG